MKRSKDTPLDAQLRALQGAAKRLEDGQGRIARRNARRAVAGALRAFRAALDKDFPLPSPPRKAPTKRKPMLSAASTVFEMKDRGFMPVGHVDMKRFEDIALAGIRERVVLAEGTFVPGSKGAAVLRMRFLPTWAVVAPPGTPLRLLRKAKTDKQTRAALLAAAGGSS